MSTPRIRKAVFPVAGLGTRFLPATKASPKEMLPVVDKPLIQYAVEEAVQAGVEVLVFVTSRTKRPIEDHFDSAYELETELARRGRKAELEMVQSIVPPHVTCVYIRQAEALGLGHAVLCAEAAVGHEPFFVILADDLIDGGKRSALQQMADVYAKHQSSVVGIERVQPDETHRYGIISPKDAGPRLHQVQAIVEKPKPEVAPSRLGVVGRYILTPRIFELIKSTGRGAGNEIQLTDAIAALLEFEKVYGYEFEGVRYDCGSKLGYLRATVEFGLKHTELGDTFRDYLKMIGSDLTSGRK
ncbi:MAG TPA: UTP--glucose-1-phosphate uridylyltransferase GalU [Gammaproteobacteria bacterium]|jgi:UTP--glucose-1-phosphate uridylyltransferase|nr:UTP--glucose-1-phosphate uridylyltransferase GalU [Gammaproteobacteria bacterium]